MSTHTDTLRQVRRGTATMRGRAVSPSQPSSTTQSFFARGEEQEATGYENLAPDDPLLVPPELEFDSFDKIPHRRGSWFAIVVSTLVLVAIGFVTWRSFRYLAKPDSSVAAASRAMVQAPPVSPAPAPAVPPAAEPEPMSVAPATPPAPVTEPPPATRPAPVTEPPPAPVAQPEPPAAPEPVHRRPAKRATADEPVHGRHTPLRGYVWSPEKHTLVPAEPAAEDPLPRRAPLRGYVWSPEKHTLVPAEPAVEDSPARDEPGARSLDGAPGAEPQPQLAPAPTSPAPFRPSPSSSPPPRESTPIID